MAKLHIPPTIDTSNPVGDVVFKRPSRERRDLMSTLVARIRRAAERSRRTRVERP
jgi:hypothetical protein